jgi:uncharacterized protein YndB with AHSA1/START domain
MSAYLVSESRTIAAPAQQLFDIVADPAMHPRIDGSGSVRAIRDGAPDRLAMGTEFGADMTLGRSYRITNTVVEFDEGRRIAWRHFNGHRWRYLFESIDANTTEVTEQWDADSQPIWNKLTLRLLRFPDRNRAGIKATLQRLDEFAITAR